MIFLLGDEIDSYGMHGTGKGVRLVGHGHGVHGVSDGSSRWLVEKSARGGQSSWTFYDTGVSRFVSMADGHDAGVARRLCALEFVFPSLIQIILIQIPLHYRSQYQTRRESLLDFIY